MTPKNIAIGRLQVYRITVNNVNRGHRIYTVVEVTAVHIIVYDFTWRNRVHHVVVIEI